MPKVTASTQMVAFQAYYWTVLQPAKLGAVMPMDVQARLLEEMYIAAQTLPGQAAHLHTVFNMHWSPVRPFRIRFMILRTDNSVEFYDGRPGLPSADYNTIQGRRSLLVLQGAWRLPSKGRVPFVEQLLCKQSFRQGTDVSAVYEYI